MGAQIRKHLAVCRTLTAGKAWWILVQEATNNKLFMIHRHSWREPCAAPSLDSRFSCSAKREVNQIIQGRAPAFRLEWGRILLVTAKLENPSPINFVSHQFDAIVCGRCFTRSNFFWFVLQSFHRILNREGRISKSAFYPAKDFCLVLTIWRQAGHKTFIKEISNHDILKPPSTVNNPNTTRIRCLEVRWISNHRACNLFAYLSQAQCLERWPATSQLFTPLSQPLYEHQGLT